MQSHLNEGFACAGVYSNGEFVRKAEGAQMQRNFNNTELEALEEEVDLPSFNKKNNS